MENESFCVRKGRLSDAEKIYALIHLHNYLLVPRSLGNIVENIDRFLVAEAKGTILGCAAYSIHPELGAPESATVEIQSVAVLTPYRRQGVGRALIAATVDVIRTTGTHEAVVLTFAPAFFGALGFHEIPKTKILHKLYTGCINCTKHSDPYTCPEIAMVLELAKK